MTVHRWLGVVLVLTGLGALAMLAGYWARVDPPDGTTRVDGYFQPDTRITVGEEGYVAQPPRPDSPPWRYVSPGMRQMKDGALVAAGAISLAAGVALIASRCRAR
jgi:uncharacterized protein YjeT (DUF2065 family)